MSLRAVRRYYAALAVAVTVTVACPPDEFVPVVTTIAVSPSTRAFTALTDTTRFSAQVRDQNGDAMTGQTVVWGTSSGTIATVSPAGLVTAQSVGSAMITATIGTVVGQATVTITQVPASLFRFDGDAQSASVGATLGVPLIARVLDALSQPVAGVTVGFAATTGGGSVGSPTTVSDAQGLVSSTWTMGFTTGPVTATASSSGVNPLIFNATALAAPPDTVIKESTDGQNVPAGTAVSPAPAVRVRDQFSNPVSGVTVTFAITQGGGQLTGATVTTNTSGIATVGSWLVGATGTQELTATATGGGIGGNPITFTVTSSPAGAPTNIVVAGGNNQLGLFGYALNVPPSARVRDAANNPVQGVSVDFQVTAGGGSLTGATATTDLQGIAQVGSWTINFGGNTLTASVTGIATPATFNATGDSSRFNIQLVYVPGTTPSPTQSAAFDSAAARWSRVIFGDLTDFIGFNIPNNACGRPEITQQTQNIDDVLIFVMLVPIDGPGMILGSAGPCSIRTSNSLSIYGLMRFDTADLANMETNGTLRDVILHEMAHVLGLGTLWGTKGLITGAGGSDPFFTGAQTRARFDAIGGTGYTAGGKVPVENTGGGGTRDAHWRETVFTNELMTGFISGATRPLSVVTAAQFLDEGYLVNLAASDAFSVSFPLLRAQGAEAGIHLMNDIYRTPIIVVDDAGRVLRVIQPR